MMGFGSGKRLIILTQEQRQRYRVGFALTANAGCGSQTKPGKDAFSGKSLVRLNFCGGIRSFRLIFRLHCRLNSRSMYHFVHLAAYLCRVPL